MTEGPTSLGRELKRFRGTKLTHCVLCPGPGNRQVTGGREREREREREETVSPGTVDARLVVRGSQLPVTGQTCALTSQNHAAPSCVCHRNAEMPESKLKVGRGRSLENIEFQPPRLSRCLLMGARGPGPLNPAPLGLQQLSAVLTRRPRCPHPLSVLQAEASERPSGLPARGGWAQAPLRFLPTLRFPRPEVFFQSFDNGVGIAGRRYK